MEEKPANELDGLQRHRAAPAVVSVVLPLKGNVGVFQGSKPVVGDGHPMGIARQILENAPRSTEGRLDVHYPFDVSGFLTQGVECGRLS